MGSAITAGNDVSGRGILIRYAPFVLLCAYLFLSPVIPDIKLTRPKLLFTEISLYGTLFVWFCGNLFFGEVKLKKSILNIPLTAYVFSVIVFFLLSLDKPVAVSELRRSLLSLAAFVAVSNVIDSRKKRDIALSCLVGGSSLAVLYGILQHYGGFWILQVPQFPRVLSTFGNPIFFAAFIVGLLPAAAGLVFYVDKKSLKLVLFVFCVSCLVALYFTQTRAAFIGAGVSAFYFIFVTMRSAVKKAAFAVVLFLAIAFFAFATKDIWMRQQAHILIWKDTITMWSQKPFFGTGPGTFHIYFPQYASKDLIAIWPQDKNIINDAHNEYIQYLSETGIVGFGLFLWVIVAFFKNAKLMKVKTGSVGEGGVISGFAAGAAGLLVQNMFSVDMRFIISSVSLFTAAGFIESFNDEYYFKEGLSGKIRASALLVCSVLATVGFQKVIEPYAAQKKVAAAKDFFDEKILEPVKTISELEALVVKYPAQASIYEKLGWVYSKEKNWPRAVENYKRSAELNPHSAGPLNNLGNIYFLTGDTVNAIKFWHRSLVVNPAQVDSRLNLALAYYYRGRLKDASDQLKEVLKLDPGNEKAIVMFKQMTE